MGRYSLAESPSGLIHHVQIFGNPHFPRAVTRCGSEVNWESWTRISMYDERMVSKGPRAVKAMIDSACTCDRCFAG